MERKYLVFWNRFLYLSVLFTLLMLPAGVNANKVFDFNAGCQQAYSSIIQWKMAEGSKLIQAEKRRNPDNLIPYFLENYIDFFVLFFNEDPAEYKIRRPRIDRRLALMGLGDRSSPFYNFTKTVINFQSAAVDIKFGKNWDAGWSFRRAFLLSRETVRLFPSFEPARYYYGSMQVAASSIPSGYKWLSNLLGIQGDAIKGMQMMEQFINDRDGFAPLFRNEAIFYYLYLKFHIQNDPKGVFEFLKRENINTSENHLFTYLATNLYLNNQQSEEAFKILSTRKADPGYLLTPIWDLEMGYIRINQLNPDASVYLQRFLSTFKGKFYVKDVLSKLSWLSYLEGDMAKAEYYRKAILQRGSMDTEADKNAQKFANSADYPDKLLLRSRLLNDGGYYQEALKLIAAKSADDFSKPADKLEFLYRSARLYDAVNEHKKAIAYYESAYRFGEKRPEYFAARAALQLGFLYEKRKDQASAAKWFKLCMALKNHEFKNSLDQKAKAGLHRVE